MRKVKRSHEDSAAEGCLYTYIHTYIHTQPQTHTHKHSHTYIDMFVYQSHINLTAIDFLYNPSLHMSAAVQAVYWKWTLLLRIYYEYHQLAERSRQVVTSYPDAAHQLAPNNNTVEERQSETANRLPERKLAFSASAKEVAKKQFVSGADTLSGIRKWLLLLLRVNIVDRLDDVHPTDVISRHSFRMESINSVCSCLNFWMFTGLFTFI